jgi:phosphohistidine phosphatase
MGRRLKATGQVPDLLISSPAVRAITTARMAAREMGFPEHRIIEDRALYHASASQLSRILQSLETLAGHVMLVGHNPGLTDFANDLSQVRIDNLPTASLFCVDLDISDWGELDRGTGHFAYFDFPKNTRGSVLTRDDF